MNGPGSGQEERPPETGDAKVASHETGAGAGTVAEAIPVFSAPVDPAPPPETLSPLRGLDELCFWAVFFLACAIISPPILVPASLAGIGATCLAYYRAGLARSAEAADDIQFTRFFLGVTLVVYAVIAATHWEIGLWVLMLCGMFLLHCVRNLLIVERVIVLKKPALPEEDRSGQAVLASVDAALEEVLDERLAAGIDTSALSAMRERLREGAKRHFLLAQRGALFLKGEPLKDVRALEADLAVEEGALEAAPEAPARDLRALKAASLRRILDASRQSQIEVARFRNAVEAIDEVLGDIDRWLEREDWIDDMPGWLAAAAPVLEATLLEAEASLEPLGRKDAI